MLLEINTVLISDELDAKCVEVLTENGIKVTKNTKMTKDELVSEIPKYDGLIVRSSTKVTADVILAGCSLKIIGRAGSGVDNIDCDEATKCGVIVMNTPLGNTLSAAEHTCAMICSLAREIPNAVASVKAGKWERKKFMGTELYQKTLAIIGLGRIGKEVALRMQSFGMKTIGYDPIVSAEESAEFNCEWLPLDEIWPQCHYITVHTPLIPQTKNLIGEDVFRVVPRGVRVVNVARGGIIDEEALLAALDSGECVGAALDVYVEEPPTNAALLAHPKVICTPHLGANTHEAQRRVAGEIAQQIVDARNGKNLFGAVNAQHLADFMSPHWEPVAKLAQALGKVAATRLKGINPSAEIDIQTFGEDLVKPWRYLKAAALTGLLATSEGQSVNLVSVPLMEKSLGLQIMSESSQDEEGPDGGRIRLTVRNPDMVSVGGQPGPRGPMLTDIDNAKFTTPFLLGGSSLLVRTKCDETILCTILHSLGIGKGGDCKRSDNTVISASASTKVDGETWWAIRTRDPIANLQALNEKASCIVQLIL